MRPPKPTTHGEYVTTPSGLIVPPGYHAGDPWARRHSAGAQRLLRRHYSNFQQDGFAYGLRLERDPETLVIRWAAKGSGLDDEINRAIADGEISNVGISPLIFPQLNGLMKRRQNLAYSTSVTVTGRSAPATRASNAIARFNDSPLGTTESIRQIIYQLDTFNRGAPIATVPIIYPTDQWENEAMHLIPIPGPRRGTIDDELNLPSDKYYLEVDWNIRKTPVPYLPSPFDLEPTGNAEWPYWYHTRRTQRVPASGRGAPATEHDEKNIWVLLHNSQILSILPSHSGANGVGTSSVWICLGFLGEHVLAIDERYEAMIDAPKNGIISISGVSETATEIRDHIENGDPGDAPPIGNPLGGNTNKPPNTGVPSGPLHDWTLITSPQQISFDSFRFRQTDGVNFNQRQSHFEDVLALAFDETIQAVVVRGGVGYGTQGETASNNVAEGGVFALLKATEVALGSIYPRVSISLTKVNDRARQLQLILLDKFASAIAKLPVDTFTRDEVRATIDRDIMTIPATGSDQIQTDARPGAGAENEDGAPFGPQAGGPLGASASAEEKQASLAIIQQLNEMILDDLAELDALMQEMLALQPMSQHASALQAALQLTAQPLAAIALQPDYSTLVLQRLRHLQQIMREMDMST